MKTKNENKNKTINETENGSKSQMWWDKMCGWPEMTVKERKEVNRSRVRIWVTYLAAFYLFIGGPIFCYFLFNQSTNTEGNTLPGVNDAKDLFMTILPISSGILAYWFAARGAEKKER